MNLTPTLKPNGIAISDNNPFKTEIEQFRRAMKQSNRSLDNHGTYRKTRITVIEQTEYFPGAFAKLYQNKELLEDLSPEACKVLLHIAVHMNFEEELIQIKACDVMMEKRRTFRGITELLGKRILCKEKREWYWVNITLLIVGNIRKED